MPDESDAQNHHRASPRVPVNFEVQFEGRNVQGMAYARNISVSGALLDQADQLLLAGGEIRLRFSLLPDAVPIEVTARVARETETGFAVEFAGLDSRLRSILRMAIHRARQAGVDACMDEEEGRTLLGPRSY